jgi:hypothetical protein
MSPANEPSTVTLRQASAIWGVGLSAVRKAATQGLLPTVRDEQGYRHVDVAVVANPPRCAQGCGRITFAVTGLCRQHVVKLPKFFSAEARERMSAAKRGLPLRAEHREKIAATMRLPETREKCGAANRGRKLLPEHRAKIGAALRGRSLSPEHREKSAAAQRGVPKPREALYPAVERECPSCKETFWVAGSRLRQGHGKYCSRACLGQANGVRISLDPEYWSERTRALFRDADFALSWYRIRHPGKSAMFGRFNARGGTRPGPKVKLTERQRDQILEKRREGLTIRQIEAYVADDLSPNGEVYKVTRRKVEKLLKRHELLSPNPPRAVT